MLAPTDPKVTKIPSLTQAEVEEARTLYARGKGKYSINDLATRYGVKKTTMFKYLNDPTKKGRPDE